MHPCARLNTQNREQECRLHSCNPGPHSKHFVHRRTENATCHARASRPSLPFESLLVLLLLPKVRAVLPGSDLPLVEQRGGLGLLGIVAAGQLFAGLLVVLPATLVVGVPPCTSPPHLE